MVSLLERKYVSKYSLPTFALRVRVGGVPASADGPVHAILTEEGEIASEWDLVVPESSTEPGLYEVRLTSSDTSRPGYYTLQFQYSIDGDLHLYGFDIEVGESSPAYDALSLPWQGVVESVWYRFADLFDSPYGGPNLQTYIQTNFNRNRLAHLLVPALNRLNSASSPHAFYPLGGTEFPFEQYGGLLAQSLYIEVLKHLVRSYVEQPEVILGTAVSRLDRRDYMNRWQQVLDMEMADFERDLSRYKMSSMNLGGVHVLVSGGAFGNMGPIVNTIGVGAAAARGYWAVVRTH